MSGAEGRKFIFRKPDFIGDNEAINPHEIQGPEFVPGKVTVVRSMDELPVNIADKIPELKENPDGYIVKQYYQSPEEGSNEHSVNKICSIDLEYFEQLASQTETPFPLSAHNWEELSLVDCSYILKNRQDQLKRYYDDVLPDLIVDSEFFIAGKSAGSGDKKDSSFYLYEIQDRLKGFITFNHIEDELHGNWKNKDQEVLKNLLSQLTAFYDVSKKMLSDLKDEYFKDYIPDFHFGNIVVMPNGDLKIFDTNIMYSKHHDQRLQQVLSECKILMAYLKNILKV